MQTDDIKNNFDKFDAETRRRLKNEDFPNDGNKSNPADWAEFMNHNEDFQEEFDRIFRNKDVPKAGNKFTLDTHTNTYLNMELAIPRDGDEPDFAKVTKHLKDANGIPIGTANNNPILDTRLHEVKYPDGYKTSLTANTIAQSLFAQVNEEGNIHMLFDEIVDHQTDGNKIKQQDALIVTSYGTIRRKETAMEGW